ncbi:MAG TPA: RNase adapter RapZ [Polyangiaceae bacterium]
MSDARSESPRLLVFVTGLSGAGRSTAVAALEDLGFFCIDNLPSPVVAATLDTLARHGVSRIAFGIDVRVGAFFDSATGVIDTVREVPGMDVQVLFLDASDEALLRRFGSTRRPHPLNAPGTVESLRGPNALLEGIGFERTRLSGLRDRATTVVDTTALNVHELRRRVIELYGPEAGKLPKLRTRITSFGFKYGVPIDADLLFDVRFLKNPFFVEELRHFTGQEREVSEYVLADDDAKQFLTLLKSFVDFCLPRFESEGRSYLTLAIGCTGGQHRSVAVAEVLAAHLRQYGGRQVDVVHRDAERNRHSDRPVACTDRGTI